MYYAHKWIQHQLIFMYTLNMSSSFSILGIKNAKNKLYASATTAQYFYFTLICKSSTFQISFRVLSIVITA